MKSLISVRERAIWTVLANLLTATWLLVAVSGNGWAKDDNMIFSPTGEAFIGLWNVCFKSALQDCRSTEDVYNVASFWTGTRAMILIATLAGLASLVFGVFSIAYPKRWIFQVIIVTGFVAWFFCLIGAAVWSANWKDGFTRTTGVVSLSWAFAFSWVAAVFGAITNAMYIFWVYGELDKA